MGCGKARFGRKLKKKHLKLKTFVSKFVPWDPEASRTDLEATRTDLEAGRNYRKRSIPHPKKRRRRSLWSEILLCFLGCGIARFLSLRPASSSVRVSWRSYRSLHWDPCGLPRGPITGCLVVSCASRLEVPGNNFETKIVNSRCFWHYHTPLQSKIRVLADRIFLW